MRVNSLHMTHDERDRQRGQAVCSPLFCTVVYLFTATVSMGMPMAVPKGYTAKSVT